MFTAIKTKTETGYLPVDSITGSINIDYDYDTTYVQHLYECELHELRLIYDYEGYVSEDVRLFAETELIRAGEIFPEEEEEEEDNE